MYMSTFDFCLGDKSCTRQKIVRDQWRYIHPLDHDGRLLELTMLSLDELDLELNHFQMIEWGR